MKKILLNGHWSLYVLSDSDYMKHSPQTVLGDLGKYCGTALQAQVPESTEITLEREKIIPPLYYGTNIEIAQTLEYNHYFYVRTFEVADEKEYQLIFEGIDTFSEIYLNGKEIAQTDNMHLVYTLPALPLKRGSNTLLVHILPAAIESRRYEAVSVTNAMKFNRDSLFTRKAAYMYGWDIMPRILSGGIWRDVYLEEKPQYSFKQYHLYTAEVDVAEKNATMHLFCAFDLGRDRYQDFSVELTGNCGEKQFSYEFPVWSTSVKHSWTLQDCLFWWPRGSGEQNLYECQLRLKKNGLPVAAEAFRFGIRTARLDFQSHPDSGGKGKFCFIINNRPIFILGTNWVPTDALPSRTTSRNGKVLELVKDIGCNMIRIWGGGLYEAKEVYDYCDKNGILVWQDFAFACGLYPQDQAFLNRLQIELTQVVHRLRQHCSIVLWAGDNECDDACYWSGSGRNPNDNKITRQLLPDILKEHDVSRSYLPSSPYIDQWCYENNRSYRVEDHLWGPRDYFKSDFYKNATAVFASETGYHGCPSVASMRKFISPEKLWPYENNGEWLLHASSMSQSPDEPFAYRIPLMANQIKVLFGAVPDNLQDFSIASQFSQGEAKKYFIERMRMRKWDKTGIIWWNICDGWPQFSDAVVDYYFDKKLAYYYIKRSQQPLCLMFDEPENGQIRLFACNDTQEQLEFCYQILDADTQRIVYSGDYAAEKDSANAIATLSAGKDTVFYLIRWECRQTAYSGINHYLLGTAPYSLEQYKKWYPCIQ